MLYKFLAVRYVRPGTKLPVEVMQFEEQADILPWIAKQPEPEGFTIYPVGETIPYRAAFDVRYI